MHTEDLSPEDRQILGLEPPPEKKKKSAADMMQEACAFLAMSIILVSLVSMLGMICIKGLVMLYSVMFA